MNAVILLAQLLLPSFEIDSADPHPPLCAAGSYCQRRRASATFHDLLCAVHLGSVDEAVLKSEQFHRSGSASDEDFAAVEKAMREALRQSKFGGRDQFDASDVASSSYLTGANISDFEQQWFGKHLRAMREPDLSSVVGETYRFLWLRTFHAPISVRITWVDKAPVLVAKLLSGQGGYDPGLLCSRHIRELATDEAERVRACFANPKVWKQEPRPRGGKDGARWIIEAKVNRRYLFANAWTPDDGAIRDCGLELLRLSGLPLDPIY
jgi:hypothetical protein